MSLTMRRRNRTRPVDSCGATAVEFAIVLPILLLFTFGLIDFGRAIWTQGTLHYAAQATARCAAIGSCSDPVSYGQSKAYGFDQNKITVTATSLTPPCYKVSTSFTYFLPLLSSFSGTFSATACYPG
jgi:Flp pilus assembly protein TadG